MIHTPGRAECDCERFHHTTQKSTQLKLYEWFISGIFHWTFSDQSWPWVSETTEHKTARKRGRGVGFGIIRAWSYNSGKGKYPIQTFWPTWGGRKQHSAILVKSVSPPFSVTPIAYVLNPLLCRIDLLYYFSSAFSILFYLFAPVCTFLLIWHLVGSQILFKAMINLMPNRLCS